MKSICFIGLSIDTNEAKKILDIEYLNPVQAGDIPTAISEYHPKIIGIIDGFFHTTASVLHKDILFALSQGIQVIGAASIGALRATELQKYGMIGCGKIFQDYLSGTIDGDDEVAVPVFFSPKEKKWITLNDCEALVNIRATLYNALSKDYIQKELVGAILNHAKRLSFFQRKWSILLDYKQYGYKNDPFIVLRNNLQAVIVDQKKNDAICLLKTIQNYHDNPSTLNSSNLNRKLFPKGPFWEETLYSRPLSLKNRISVNNNPLLQDLLVYVILSVEDPNILKDSIIRTLLLEIASIIGIKSDDEDVKNCLISFSNSIEDNSLFSPLTKSDLYELAVDEVTCEYLYEHFIKKIQRGIILTLLSENTYFEYKNELMNKWSKKEFYHNNKDQNSIIYSYLKSQNIDNIEDYYERFLSWIPQQNLIHILKNI